MSAECNHKCPYERGAEGDLTIEREGNMAMEAGIGVMYFEDGEKWGRSQGIQATKS